MAIRNYSHRLGMLADEQFQAALDRFGLGTLVKAEPISFGLFGQNVFVTSTSGEYVLRGDPHFPWQFPTERFYAQQLHEHTRVPVPWPYLIDPATDIFGWSYVLMPRMPGLQLADEVVRNALSQDEHKAIVRAIGENLAHMQQLTWPHPGRYDAETNTVRPLELYKELVWPHPVRLLKDFAVSTNKQVLFAELVIERIRFMLACSRQYSSDTTEDDIAWVEELIGQSRDALDEPFVPCIVMEDYKRDNLVVTHNNGRWQVSGVFDLMACYVGDGEVDLSRTVAMYRVKEPLLAREFVQAYCYHKPPRPGFLQRFPLYVLLDRAILWDYFQSTGVLPWGKHVCFRAWAEPYTSFQPT